jgi:transcriptional regulator with XRE-family HTH domain
MPPEYDAKMFGRNLALLRQRRGLSGAQLAERSGVDRKNIWRIEMGVTSPRLVTMLALADGLGVDPPQILEGLRP